MGLLEGIVVAAFAIGLAMGILLRKCVCRPCGFCGGDGRKVFKASKILKPAPVQKKKRWPLLRTSLSDYFCWTILYETRLPDAQDAKKLRYARIAWEILRRDFIQSKLSTNWSPKKDPGATTGLFCVLQKWFSHFSQFFGHYVNPKYLMLVGRWGTLGPPFCRQQPPWMLPFCRCPHTIL